MRQYLECFFEDFKYDKSDAKYFLEVYDIIASDKDAIGFLQEALMLYNNNIKCDYNKILE